MGHDSDAAIHGIGAEVYRVPTDQPEADGTFSWDATTMVVVHADAGGETGMGWTYSAAAAGALIGDLLAPTVHGWSALQPAAAYHAMARAVRNIGRAGIAATAISAVDNALWDLKARLLGVPLAGLLGPVRHEVPVYGSGGFTTYDDATLERQLGGWVHDDGIPNVKIKIGEGWGTHEPRDLRRIALARRTIGVGAGLFVDANGAYTPAQAIRMASRFAHDDVTWFEEPVSSDDLAGLHRVRDAVHPDVTAGEYGWDLPYFERMCAAGAVDCVQVDVTRCGGITEWQRICAVAAAHGLDVSAHCAPHAHLDVAAATDRLRHVEWFHDHVRIERMLFDGAVDAIGGVMRPVPGRTGHGLALRRQDAERYRVG